MTHMATPTEYEDTRVQLTNTLLIFSKRSVEQLYFPHVQPPEPPFYKYFVAKLARRLPAINRGYWIRIDAIKQGVEAVARSHAGVTVVVGLGCGYDPLPFQMANHPDLVFVDIDYPELIALKASTINTTPELARVFGPLEQTDGVWWGGSRYCAFGCNLRDERLFARRLQETTARFGPNLSFVFVAEVLLAYMDAPDADRVLRHVATLPRTTVLILEQMVPSSPRHPFARTMLAHFAKLLLPLKCALVYPGPEDQCRRLAACGFATVTAESMNSAWDRLVTGETKQMVERVEPFDEHEEFYLFGHHYVLVKAETAGAGGFHHPPVPGATGTALRTVRTAPLPFDHRKYLAGCVLDNRYYGFGGMAFSRLGDLHVLSLDSSTARTDFPSPPSARMCHSFTSLTQSTALLAGGRQAPHKLLLDAYLFDTTGGWTPVAPLAVPRHRHAAVGVSLTEVLVCGGLTGPGLVFCVWNADLNSWRDVPVRGASVPNLHSCGITFDAATNSGYIVGGRDADRDVVSSSIFRFAYSGDAVEATVETISSPLLGRMGAAVFRVDAARLLVVGGVGSQFMGLADTAVVEVEMAGGSVRTVPVSPATYQQMAVDCGSVGVQMGNTAVMVGGGATCYGFGSVWGDVLYIDM